MRKTIWNFYKLDHLATPGIEVDEEVSRAETEPETETKLEENEEKQVMSMDRKENEKSGGTRDNEVTAGWMKSCPHILHNFPQNLQQVKILIYKKYPP